jgi:hypothetical protein
METREIEQKVAKFAKKRKLVFLASGYAPLASLGKHQLRGNVCDCDQSYQHQ